MYKVRLISVNGRQVESEGVFQTLADAYLAAEEGLNYSSIWTEAKIILEETLLTIYKKD